MTRASVVTTSSYNTLRFGGICLQKTCVILIIVGISTDIIESKQLLQCYWLYFNNLLGYAFLISYLKQYIFQKINRKYINEEILERLESIYSTNKKYC